MERQRQKNHDLELGLHSGQCREGVAEVKQESTNLDSNK